jgi:hypothetical protein
VPVEPMKVVLKTSGTKRSKLNYALRFKDKPALKNIFQFERPKDIFSNAGLSLNVINCF